MKGYAYELTEKFNIENTIITTRAAGTPSLFQNLFKNCLRAL
jgi:hypothetical protein